MKKRKIFLATALLFSLVITTGAQDVRRLSTRVADLLAAMPAANPERGDALMEEMYSLGDDGWTMICEQVVPAGNGDDLRARYAISAMTSHLAVGSDVTGRNSWEDKCIMFMEMASDREVKSFFMSQLRLTGSDRAVRVLGNYLSNPLFCDEALTALGYIGSSSAAEIILRALRSETLPCAAQAMALLADIGPGSSVDLFSEWYSRGDVKEKRAALLAMAATGLPEAEKILMAAAAAASYRNEETGAVQALLSYARERGREGDIKRADKIASKIIKESRSSEQAGQRVAAMSLLVELKGNAALPLLLRAANDPDIAVRGGALLLATDMPGNGVTGRWIKSYDKAPREARPGILWMLGERNDPQAAPLVLKALKDPSPEIVHAAAPALAALLKAEAVEPLIASIVSSDDQEIQNAAAGALTTILDGSAQQRVAAALHRSEGSATVTLLRLLAWTGNSDFFTIVYPYASSEELTVRAAALASLGSLASWSDQPEIIALLESSEEKYEITELQKALMNAALQSDDPDRRAELILEAMDKGVDKLKLIPLLSYTGGDQALKRVAYEFEKGDAYTRDECFDALSHWRDHSAAKVLLEITASGNKTFGRPAFDAYLQAVSANTLTPERKLLMIKDIASYVPSAEGMADMIALAGSLEIMQAKLFLESLDENLSPEMRALAAETVRSMSLPEQLYESMFNGKDLEGCQGLVGTPITRASMKPKELAAGQKEANIRMTRNWSVKDGLIWFSGAGDNLCSVKDYGDFEMFADWRITEGGDSGIYLRGSPQVQIWDTSRFEVGAQVGSGGLYNNQIHRSTPLKVADNPVGEWNNFRIVMTGERVSVWLNGELVVDDVVMENYWDRSRPIFDRGAIELQAHGTDLTFRDIYVREIEPSLNNLTAVEREEGFVSLFNGENLEGWTGNKRAYHAEDGMIVIRPDTDSGGNLYTVREYADFVFRFEFLLSPGANNGLGIRTPLEGDAAYVGMELQILDNSASIYANLEPYQYHGSVYGVIPARRGFLRPVGEWNYQEVTVKDTKIKVVLNGTVILDGDIAGAIAGGTIDGRDHPGLVNKKGHIGFLGHGSLVQFRNIRIKEL